MAAALIVRGGKHPTRTHALTYQQPAGGGGDHAPPQRISNSQKNKTHDDDDVFRVYTTSKHERECVLSHVKNILKSSSYNNFLSPSLCCWSLCVCGVCVDQVCVCALGECVLALSSYTLSVSSMIDYAIISE